MTALDLEGLAEWREIGVMMEASGFRISTGSATGIHPSFVTGQSNDGKGNFAPQSPMLWPDIVLKALRAYSLTPLGFL